MGRPLPQQPPGSWWGVPGEVPGGACVSRDTYSRYDTEASTVEGRGVLKSTLTTLSVLGERMKARDPRRSPCADTGCISADEDSGRAPQAGLQWPPQHLSPCRAETPGHSQAVLDLRGQPLCVRDSTSAAPWGVSGSTQTHRIRKAAPVPTGGPSQLSSIPKGGVLRPPSYLNQIETPQGRVTAQLLWVQGAVCWGTPERRGGCVGPACCGQTWCPVPHSTAVHTSPGAA